MVSKICEVCGSKNLEEVLDLGQQPLCDDLIPLGEKNICKTYPIKILWCNKCKTAHQSCNVPKKTLFPNTYHYRSRFTQDVLNGMNDLVESVKDLIPKSYDLNVLDIGCNDGSLLDIFRNKGFKNTIGIEPTGAYLDASEKGHKIYNSYFDSKSAQLIKSDFKKIDVITFTNVFAHIEDLPTLLKNLDFIINDDTLLIIENHYIGSVLKTNQFDTFYHEHPRTYSLNSFSAIAKTLDMKLINVFFPKRYGGNIRVIFSRKSFENIKKIDDLLEFEETFFESFENMRNFINKWKIDKRKTIDNLVKENGPLAAKAFPGRASILIKLLELNINDIYGVFEKIGSPKISNYVPGTRIPIMDEREFFSMKEKPKAMLNMAWHIKDEINEYMKNNNYFGEIINIVD